ncbi:SGNH/GDSL hydrolase family protein [Mycoplasma sp. AC157]|uniref:SGNH/GDSL hydrolase family protein n=1 Tax=Mycoplasma sp. 480 TaxID=3440155 RepID=UPI003F50F439
MKKKTKIILGASAGLTLSVAVITIPSVLYVQQNLNKSDNSNNSQKTKITNNDQKDLLKDNINYLAIGDSISAGFNSEYGFEIAGDLKNNQIEGLSFPAFLANYINKLKPNAIHQFNNYALSGTRIVDWLYLLDAPNANYNLKAEKGYFQFLLSWDDDSLNPFRHRIKEAFGDFQKENLENLKNKIKESNLITISLGANDLFGSLNFNNLEKLFNKETQKEAIFNLKQDLERISKENYVNLNKLVSKIKEINSKTEIVLVGYPMPLLRLLNIIDHFFSSIAQEKVNLSNQILDSINAVSKKVAIETKINYIETFDEDDWKSNNDKWAKSIFDIHPTELGYKKMAQDIILKLSLNDIDKNYSLVKNWDENYIDKDKNAFHKIFDFSKNNEEIVKIISNSKLFNDEILEKSNYQTELNKEKSKLFSMKRIVLNWINANHHLTNQIINSFISKIKEKYGINDEIVELFNEKTEENKTFIFKLMEEFLRTDFIDVVILKLQKYFDENDLDLNGIEGTQIITSKLLLEELKTIFKDQKFILRILKQFLKSDFAIKNKNKLTALTNFATTFILENLDKLNLVNLKENKATILTLTKEKSFIKVISDILNDFIINENHYDSINDFNSLFVVYLENHKEEFKTNLINFIKSLKNNETILNVISNTIEQKLNLENPQENKENILPFITDLIGSVDKIDLVLQNIDKLIDSFVKGELSFNNFSFEKVISILDFNSLTGDLTKLADFFKLIETGDISIENFVNFFNVIIENSPFSNTENLTKEKNLFFYYLNNINNDPDTKKRTSLSISDITKLSGDSLVSKITLISTKAFEKYKEFKKTHPNVNELDNPYRKFLYRFSGLILWYAYETYARESSVRGIIYYSFSPFNIEKSIYNSLAGKSKEQQSLITSIFGNRYSSFFGDSAKSIHNNDLMKMIYYNTEANKHNIKWRENLFKFIKQGKPDLNK